MWCRTILTAVAISYVICVLLLSGLQKEDLDADTLGKLRRHNVNIDDMNNEQQRQECLLNSYSDTEQKNETTEGQNKALEESTTTTISNKKDLKDYLKQGTEVPENIEDKTILQSGIDNNKTHGLIKELQTLNNNLKTNDVKDDLGNVTKIEENNGLQIEYLQNQPALQSVMNFWTKLTHNTKKVVTKVATSPATPNIIEERNIRTTVETSLNNGYVHSREMEYISRILAEYVASQTVPTTTQRVTTKKVYIGLIAKRIQDYIKRTPVDETQNSLLPADIERLIKNNLRILNNFTRINEIPNPKKNIEQSLNNNKRKTNNFTGDDVRPRNVDNIYYMTDETKNIRYDSEQQKENIQDSVHQRAVNYNYMTAEIKSVPYKVTYDNKELMKHIIQDKSYNQQKLTEKNNPIHFLNYLLQNERGFETNGATTPNTETTTESIKLLMSEQKENSDKFNQYRIVQYNLPNFNNSDYKNLDPNQNVAINKYQFKDEPTNTRVWEPIRNYRMINQQFHAAQANNIETDQQPNFNINNEKFKVRAIMKMDPAENFEMNDQFKTVPSNINDSKRIKTFKANTKFKGMPIDINNSEPMQNVNKEQFKPNPPGIRTWNQNKNTNMDNDELKYMLPSIKKLKQNQNSKINNRENSRTELNKADQIQDFVMHDDRFKDMVAETNRTDRNQVSIKNNDQYNVEPADIRKAELNPKLGNNNKQLNQMPVVNTKYDRLQDSKNQFKYDVQANVDNSKQNQSIVMTTEQFQVTQRTLNDFKQFKNYNEPQTIPANVIEDIAEKVRQIVLKDMRKEVPTTTFKTSSSTTTTAVPTNRTTTLASTESTKTTTEKPTTPHKEIKEANNVIQKLMEMFNEFKTMKEAVKSTTEVPPKITLKYDTATRQQLPVKTFPPAMAAFNPYIMKAPPANVLMKTHLINVKPFQISPYGPSMVPVPISSGANPPTGPAPQYVPQINFQQKNEYKSAAITIQTNADEIAPLAIQISQPMKVMNQNIIVTTKSPSEILKEEQERESKKRLDENLGPTDDRNHNEKHQLHLDLEKKVRFPDSATRHEYSDTYSYKNTLNKNREKPRYNHEYNEHFPDINQMENLSLPGSSRFPWSLPRPESSSYTGSSSYPGSSSQPGRPSYLGTSSQPENSRHPWGSSQPGGSSYAERFSHQKGRSDVWDRSHMDNFNHPRASGLSGGSMYPRGISHEEGFNNPLSRQEGIKHHAGSYGYNDPGRPYPRYEGTKFHEQLERIESWPRNNWKGHRPMSIEKNCCEEIPARQQMPLTKIKQRTRFDDTHFTNFLKSQQKVTDMLEKILASNTKSNGPQSVEVTS